MQIDNKEHHILQKNKKHKVEPIILWNVTVAFMF